VSAPLLDVAVLASGRGSNLAALLEATRAGTCRARIVGLISDNPDAGALAIAEEAGIEVTVVERSSFPTRALWDEGIRDAVQALRPKLVVLAGFMRIVGPAILGAFPDRIINIHPSLLPAFPGLHAPQQAIDAGVSVTGCTVHRVDEGVDTGAILAQGAVVVLPTDDADRLHARLQRIEHHLLPAVVNMLAGGDASPANPEADLISLLPAASLVSGR